MSALQAPDLAAFLMLPADQADAETLQKALDLAAEGIQRFADHPIPATLSHLQREAVLLMAADVLLRGRLSAPPADGDIPAVVRYLARTVF